MLLTWLAKLERFSLRSFQSPSFELMHHVLELLQVKKEQAAETRHCLESLLETFL